MWRIGKREQKERERERVSRKRESQKNLGGEREKEKRGGREREEQKEREDDLLQKFAVMCCDLEGGKFRIFTTTREIKVTTERERARE